MVLNSVQSLRRRSALMVDSLRSELHYCQEMPGVFKKASVSSAGDTSGQVSDSMSTGGSHSVQYPGLMAQLNWARPGGEEATCF